MPPRKTKPSANGHSDQATIWVRPVGETEWAVDYGKGLRKPYEFEGEAVLAARSRAKRTGARVMVSTRTGREVEVSDSPVDDGMLREWIRIYRRHNPNGAA
jgi:hypothetical protein